MFEFSVPGQPQGKARARTFYNPNLQRMQSITPEKTVLYENLIKTCFQDKANKDYFLGYFDKEPLRVQITAIFNVPKSASKKKKQAMFEGKEHPCKKPDSDNIAKVICDALNQLAYADDTQICELIVKKRYVSDLDALPEVIVGIEEMEEQIINT